jgi:hypothetical protein
LTHSPASKAIERPMDINRPYSHLSAPQQSTDSRCDSDRSAPINRHEDLKRSPTNLL